jgi:CUG-BP- and ETR3-like factor
MSIVKLYIGGLPPTTEDSTIAELLSAYGNVESVMISRDSSMKCLGYGFAKMLSETDALKAISAIHNSLKLEPDAFPNIGPIQLRIVKDPTSPSENQSQAVSDTSKPMKLFIGGVPGTATGKSLRALFQDYGEIADLFISPEKGYAFVKFSNQSDALAAMANINGMMLPNAVRPLEVRVAQSTKGLDLEETEAQLAAVQKIPTPMSSNTQWTEYFTSDGKAYYHNKVTGITQWEVPTGWNQSGIIGLDSKKKDTLPIGLDKGPPGANIFVYGLPDKWKEREFANEFGRFGDIFSIKIIYDKETGDSRGYGFISYTEPRCAQAAVDEMHGSMLNGRKLKVQIKRGEETSKPY